MGSRGIKGRNINMTSEIVPVGGYGLMRREARSTIRAVVQSKSLTQMRIAQADDSTDLAVTKLENLSLWSKRDGRQKSSLDAGWLS